MTPRGEQLPLRLLALDGGGIRGFSELLIIKQIMRGLMVKENKIRAENSQVPRKDLPKPCDYFDLICGTSTGGIIALMLGRLRMDVDKAIENYDKIARDVFSKPKRSGGDGTFSATKLEAAIKSVVGEVLDNPESPLLDANERLCRTFVCARNAHSMTFPVLFRTYESHEPPGECTIWQAARATSAAPTFFKRIDIGRAQPYIDGGLGNNNPTSLLLQEAESLFPSRRVGCLISIGTGQPFPPTVPKPGLFQRFIPTDVIEALRAIATDCESVHQTTFQRFASSPDTYFRLSVSQGMQRIELSQWEKLDEVESHTSQYLLDGQVQATLALLVNKIEELTVEEEVNIL